MTLVARAALSVLLLLGVYVLAAGVVGATGFALYQAAVHGIGGFVLGKGLVLAAFLLIALGRAFWAVARLSDGEPEGLVLAPEDQPTLWDEVHDIAAAVGTRAPDEIRLVGEVNARVKSKQKYWNRGADAEAMLQLRAALLSEDGRLDRYLAERPGWPYRRRLKQSESTASAKVATLQSR